MIEVTGIKKRFKDKEVLKGINFTFEKGKTNLIIGQSGSGKTVLLKSLVGLHHPDSGKILYDGNRDLVRMNGQEIKQFRSEIGMLFQGSALFDSMTVAENVMFPLSVYKRESYAKKMKRVHFCLDRVNLKGAENLLPSELSGGMQKRVAIARAIALNPKYLFCDEPNSGLDPKTSLLIDALIQDITHEYNMTTIINTHDMNSVMDIGENILFLYKGTVEWTGNNKEIIPSENQLLLDFVFASDLFKKVMLAQQQSDK